LFVYSIGGQANRGRDGWEYKVGGLAGSTGAGDPSGPTGNGRPISSGQRVLWFWCHAAGGGCQQTLAVNATPSTVARRGEVRATVTGWDNEGRDRPVAGATVRLGSASASTSSAGTATLRAPSSPGTYALTAVRSGLAPAFPVTVVVR
jgi:hypothetical protein